MKRRNKRKKRMIRLGIVLFLAVTILVGLFLFRVKKVVVHGNARHTSEEIASGLVNDFLTENTLYLMWKYKDGVVPDTLPYLNTIQVKMKSPSCVELIVTEKEPAAYIDKGELVYFDQNGTVLEISDEIYGGIPIVTGADTDEPVLYQKLPTESSAQLRTILSLTQLLEYQGLEAQEIRFGENMEITVFIGGVEAKLGQDEYLEEKIANLRAILEKAGDERGTLHLESFTGGKNESVPFSHAPETEPAPDSSGSSGDGMGDGAAGDGAGAGVSDGETVIGGLSDDGMADGTADGSADSAGGSADSTDGSADSTGGSADSTDGSADSTAGEGDTGQTGVTFMAFNAYGTLVYDVRVVNGVAVDANGVPVEGVTVNEQGYVVDAYMNVIDPSTGQLAQ